MLTNHSLKTIFSSNKYLSTMNKEQQHPYVHEGEKQHTNDYLNGKYPFLNFTNENKETYQLGFLRGAAYAMGKANEMLKEESPTLFTYLQNQEKELDIKNLSQMGEQC